MLSPPGGGRQGRTTAAHIGKPIALLLDGQVAMAPTLRSPITNAATITGNFSQQEAEKLATGLTP